MPLQVHLLYGTTSFLWTRLLSDIAPFSLSDTTLLSPISSPFPSTLSPFLSICSLSMPLGSPAPVLSDPQRPPSFQHRWTKQDQTEGLCSVLFGRTEGLRSAMFGRLVERSVMAERRPSVRPNRTEQRPSVWFYLVERCQKERGAGGR